MTTTYNDARVARRRRQGGTRGETTENNRKQQVYPNFNGGGAGQEPKYQKDSMGRRG
jgi:hypothetical protein